MSRHGHSGQVPIGLAFYRVLVPAAGELLQSEGYLMVEIGHGQAQDVADLISGTGLFGPVETCNDLDGIQRVLKAQKR